MQRRTQARVAVDISDVGLRQTFLQALTHFGLAPSQPGDQPAVIVKDSANQEAAPADVPVIQLWQTGRGRKNSGANPFAADATRNWIAAAPGLHPDDISTTIDHLFEHRFIGLAQLVPEPAAVVTAREQQSTAKQQHMDSLRAFLESHGASRHVCESMDLALEELFLNAAYNAPVDAAGMSLNAHKRRSDPVTSERPFLIEYRIDQNYFAMAVRDSYGTLSAERVLECLRRCYAQGGAQFEEKEGGAGLGFYMLLQQATRLVINVKANQFTEVIVLRRLGESRREFMQTTPTLNLCFVTGDNAATTSRRYARVPVQWPAQAEISGARHDTVALDVSPGGAFLALDRVDGLVRDTRLSVNLMPPGRPPLLVQARVRWAGCSNEHRRVGIGVEFEPHLGINAFLGV